ncbi:hypothetical protein PHJA_001862500 [Phtheirospermum japonicum]|uniref:Chlororespiratory reduction 42 n=1 Tax=Phtheirospermum japonicum TaxID=374723 RepID=A0A830CLX4_9LAMI|nr:hypothetical protein PHJA_001862500 [Phtheirospermum japonicum]
MALNLASVPSSGSFPRLISKFSQLNSCKVKSQFLKCELNESPSAPKLEIGSPIIVIEAPKLLKTAASVPCLRANVDLVKAGDVGRIVSRKPKDVWAVRLSIGTYLIDGKYFKPLEIED